MSAGNPFRRSQGSRLPDEIPQDNNEASKTRVGKKKKRVVIQTPPHSPEEPSIPRRLSDGRSGSPPSVFATATMRLEDEDTDSTTTADSDLEQALFNTRRNSGSLPATIPTSIAFGVQPGTRAPYNPFARTLETSEARFGLQSQSQGEGQVGREALDGASQARPGKPVIDVDAFKNILMGGSAVPIVAASVQQQRQRPQDSSSSTDTSSVSRQSIFDPMHEAHPESPRTSFDEQHHSASDEDGDDEHSSLMGPVSSRPVEEGPPRPPKSTHGRAFPQTVSFADFDDTIPTSFPPSAPRTPPINPQLQGIMRPATPRSGSDLNKPLPPPPAEPVIQSGVADLAQNTIPIVQQPPVPEFLPAEEEQAQAKKAPPPPPTSRRQGQSSATTPARGRSASNLSQSSTQQQQAEQNLKPAPPPPPSRRSQPVTSTPSPAGETPPQVPSPSQQPPTESKPMPPPPPRRHQSKSRTTSVNRTPSNASRTSLPRSDSFTASTITAAGNAPPAPPPRRGGGGVSKRNSVDASGPPNSSLSTRRASGNEHYRRASGQSFESDRSVSIGSLQQVGETGEDEGSSVKPVAATGAEAEDRRSDILADMSAFQAEIDALRAQSTAKGG